ncbi:cytochrome P450 [Kibdelosporangium banguiense]|uniref:Cytochrome P450 n=1 Tax=Kibdelosporangium banguiense TaxID=1365924 RepID=A0ABS4TJS8_9PSEU|nr:cytochrome P450 [Kibdelosporangium banguiense]MBP2324670.1 cytochrome P450 [Kibdelosporangium banguiense]
MAVLGGFAGGERVSPRREKGEAALLKITLPDGSEAWLVTEYEDVRAGLADPRLSLSKDNATSRYTGFKLPPALDRNLLNLDPPDHTRLRRLVGGAFTAHRVARMRDKVGAIADKLLGDVSGTVDLMAAYATPLPVITISDLLGAPADRIGDFRAWTDALITQGSRDAVANMYRFMLDLIAAKRADPGDDLISAMIAARDGDDRLSEDELLSLAFLILWAGYENSVHLIGNSILHTLTHGPTDIEELLRVANPNLHAIRRFPIDDIDIGGQTIPKGQTVLLDIQSANESAAKHLSFGAGIHYCVGAPLARLELEIALDRLFGTFPEVSLAVSPDALVWRDSIRSRGLLALPVTLTA